MGMQMPSVAVHYNNHWKVLANTQILEQVEHDS